MRQYCPYCQEVVAIDPKSRHAYRLTPQKHKCLDCEPHAIEGLQGWKPKKRGNYGT